MEAGPGGRSAEGLGLVLPAGQTALPLWLQGGRCPLNSEGGNDGGLLIFVKTF